MADSWFRRLQGLRLPGRTAVLVASVLAVYLLVAPLATRLGGGAGLRAAGLAAVVCLAGGLLALVLGRCLEGSRYGPWVAIIGMAPRTGIPLIALAVLVYRRGPLFEAGALYYLLVFYAVVLAVGTILSLPPAAGEDRVT